MGKLINPRPIDTRKDVNVIICALHCHEVIVIQKTATLNLRVDPEVKQSAESILAQLGLSMSTAVDMFLRQVSLTGGIPFRVALPEAPRSVDADSMSDGELRKLLLKGLAEVERSEGIEATAALAQVRKDPSMREWHVLVIPLTLSQIREIVTYVHEEPFTPTNIRRYSVFYTFKDTEYTVKMFIFLHGIPSYKRLKQILHKNRPGGDSAEDAK